MGSWLEPPFRVEVGSSFAAMERCLQELSLCGFLAGLSDHEVEVLEGLGCTVTKLATLKVSPLPLLVKIVGAGKDMTLLMQMHRPAAPTDHPDRHVESGAASEWRVDEGDASTHRRDGNRVRRVRWTCYEDRTC